MKFEIAVPSVKARRKGRLFDFGKVVRRHFVQLERADIDQRIIAIRPGFGQAEYMEKIQRINTDGMMKSPTFS